MLLKKLFKPFFREQCMIQGRHCTLSSSIHLKHYLQLGLRFSGMDEGSHVTQWISTTLTFSHPCYSQSGRPACEGQLCGATACSADRTVMESCVELQPARQTGMWGTAVWSYSLPSRRACEGQLCGAKACPADRPVRDSCVELLRLCLDHGSASSFLLSDIHFAFAFPRLTENNSIHRVPEADSRCICNVDTQKVFRFCLFILYRMLLEKDRYYLVNAILRTVDIC